MSSSEYRQLHFMVRAGGTMGSVRGVCGGVMASVEPTLDMARRSMSEVDVLVCSIDVMFFIDCLVASCVRRQFRRFVVVMVFDGSRWCRRCVRAEGTFSSVFSTSEAMRSERAKR